MHQLAIALTGCVAIWLANDADLARRRWACLFGLAGQPFWIWSAWSAEQWGILLVTGFYTLAWARGVYTHWISHA
jgi:hypothetical protein